MFSLGVGTALAATALFTATACADEENRPAAASRTGTLVGTWGSDDGTLRLALNADGTFVEDFNGRKAAYAGKYTVSGSTLTLNDKTGVTANGTINGASISLSGSTLTRKG
ncbi:hypothetical protein D0T12_23310 [Actinomadura spongiicola]|uniref:DUF5640 domain-containing protein n=1 Tax=Actinomadura spongiicola TaxID=2303421 RepID=A0A372GCJ7_9ACTN|nr:Atu4866 domain-containing protein [Actinomadura spongiicola]RFS83105.1 hypothetical protein D0T12_23310 [Actinomadura spongiicola]